MPARFVNTFLQKILFFSAPHFQKTPKSLRRKGLRGRKKGARPVADGCAPPAFGPAGPRRAAYGRFLLVKPPPIVLKL
jgi:hypothetical protein